MTKRFFFCRRLALALAVLTAGLCLLGGCGSSKLTTFTWEADAVPGNLDPQTVSSSQDIIAVTHLFSGLYRLDAAGTPQPDCAESCTVSEDGLTYTFTLKEGLKYQTYRGRKCDYTLSAADFVFGLQRVFDPATASPWADELANIQNGRAVAAGQMAPEALGVEAPDERTLIIRLEQKDDNFAARLCLPGAMPCQQEFFESSGGSYGLGVSSTMGNGPFFLYNWTDSGLFLRRGAAGSLINNLRIVLKNQSLLDKDADEEEKKEKPLTPLEKVQEGKASAALSQTGSGGTLAELPYAATTWALVYNCSHPGLSSTAVRQGLTASAAQTGLEFSGRYTAASGLLPPSLLVNGETYRDLAGEILFESGDPLGLFRAGLAEQNLVKLSGVSVLVPQGPRWIAYPSELNGFQICSVLCLSLNSHMPCRSFLLQRNSG
ncbi:MAG: hypothetical protein IIV90_04290, partial [Oscillospiraceae bacterium]|nr:hypothetical protein [Oscillospiraceae bacterium]